MCEKLIKELEEKYDLQGIDSQPLVKVIRKEDNKQCGEVEIRINKKEKTLRIEYINTKKYGCAVKGLGRDILYLLSCKAKENGLKIIDFDAYSEINQNNLERYYNSLGFMKKGERNSFPTSQAYSTNINSLLLKIKGGKRKTRNRMVKSKRRTYKYGIKK